MACFDDSWIQVGFHTRRATINVPSCRDNTEAFEPGQSVVAGCWLDEHLPVATKIVSGHFLSALLETVDQCPLLCLRLHHCHRGYILLIQVTRSMFKASSSCSVLE